MMLRFDGSVASEGITSSLTMSALLAADFLDDLVEFQVHNFFKLSIALGHGRNAIVHGQLSFLIRRSARHHFFTLA